MSSSGYCWWAAVRWHGAVVSAVVQDAVSGMVIMHAALNRDALIGCLTTGRAVYMARASGTAWRKGAGSGQEHHAASVRMDCDRDSMLLIVRASSASCHMGSFCCYNGLLGCPYHLCTGSVLRGVALAPCGTSHTAWLVRIGGPGALRKLHEELAELSAAANPSAPPILAVKEAADVCYHALVVLMARGVHPHTISAELVSRAGMPGVRERCSRVCV
ncbi:putative phosphoribosyl-ATP diphosphatase [Candidatus Tremblaya princeps PCIT]|uniref:Histidine biosynthesis bifunctional protein HisIE n=1 Tax=Tremblaya princeps (strain PCIT) TaxID=891398 RepID=F7XYH7_TREPP|nr:putative phosphoribosyl-ATP diphosphatase [Candidatus Tremblaya princeps PCIT]AEK38433.1 phosphoribosyl-ATP diphosphatase [Candidatus Tremblaya princeps PCVAL]